MQILVYEFVCEKSNPNKNIVCESKAVLDWKNSFEKMIVIGAGLARTGTASLCQVRYLIGTV